MAMPVTTHRWTRADLASLPDDGNRYEVLDGALLVTPTPTVPHELIASRLFQRLAPFVERHRLGAVFTRGAVDFGESELQPDLLVTRLPSGPLPDRWDELPDVPLLVVEILSSSTRRRDLGVKREAYLRLKISDYWVIDRFGRRALCWTPGSGDPVIVTDALRWQPARATEPLVIRLEDVLLPQAG